MKHTMIQLFTPGTEVGYNGYTYTVDHVTLRGSQLFVHLHGIRDAVVSGKLECAYTRLSLERS